MPSKNAIQLARAKFPQVQQAFIEFKGGVDLETPPLFMDPGSIRESHNYECDVLGGYRVVTGYERFDGRSAPHDAAYAVITVTLTGSFSVGNTVTGATSGATGQVIAVTSTYIVITVIVGTFVSGEVLNVAAAPQGTATSAASVDGASTPLLHAQYKNLAADVYRALIAAPTGSGDALGVVRLGDVTYTFRNNAGGTAAVIWKSSAAGWVAVPTGSEVSFTAGGLNIDEGDTLTQGGVTATIKRIVLTSGTYAGGTAAGRLVIHTVAGGNFAAGAATTTGGGALTLSGAQTLIAILPSGSYEFIVENFGGGLGTKRIYGSDSVNRGFEFGGDDYSYVPITTGMTLDKPTHVWAHKNHLFFSFAGGSVQHSAPGTPYIWSVILGASEIAVGDTVTGFASQPGSQDSGALSIFTRNRMYILYGNGVSTWNLIAYRNDIGAFADSICDIGYTVFLDEHGLTSIRTAQEYGNFSHASISEKVRRWLKAQRLKVTDCVVSGDKSQYRLFFSDQYALYVTFSKGKIVGMTQVLLAHIPRRLWMSEDSDGTERIFFCSSNGMVFEMDVGTSFDGEAIEHWMALSFDNIKSPRTLKQYREVMLEISGDGYSAFQFSYELGYGSSLINQPGSQSKIAAFSSATWDEAGAVWDALFWDGRALNKTTCDLGGTAENISLMFRGSSDYDSPIRFSGAIVHYTTRRNIR